MPTRSTLDVVDTVTEATRQANAMSSGTMGTQAAFVRALVDEVERHHPEDRRVAPLREQLGDELDRLAALLPAGAGEGRAAEERPLDVLVVDDEDGARRATAAVVKSLGYPCRTARDGEEALRAFDREPAAIVLSDWCMPGMSGLDLCAALKQRTPRPYVLLATGFHDNARLLDGVRGGADDFLRKPLEVDELEARLSAASRLLRALRAVTALSEQLRASRPG